MQVPRVSPLGVPNQGGDVQSKRGIEVIARLEAQQDPVDRNAGRAPRSQCGGREFDPPRLHHCFYNLLS
jgi:hypothetical protein